jgi:hypothetical protein
VPLFTRLFQFGPWFWISSFFHLTPDLVNFSAFIYAPFPIWSLVLDFFNQVPNWPSNFNIYSVNPKKKKGWIKLEAELVSPQNIELVASCLTFPTTQILLASEFYNSRYS